MIRKNLPYIYLFLFFSLISYTANAQPDGEPLTVQNARVHKIQSAIVPNQIYAVRVAVPDSYQSSPDREYPIVVVLDGQWNFTLTSDIAKKLAYDGMMPEVITVGITWGGEGDVPEVLRGRDFIRPDVPYFPMSGGASRFLSALTDELVPYVEERYRVSDKRVLLGVSLGGLFTSYAMLEKPGYFDGYIAIAGSYFADSFYLAEKLATMSGSKVLKNVRSFLSVGSLDPNQVHVETFNKSIKSAQLKGFEHSYKVIKDVGHGGVEPIAYTRGLQYIFERPFLKLSETFLQRYVGDYEGGPEGQPPFITLSVSVAGKGTLLIGDASSTFNYQASSESTFNVRGNNFSAEFKDGQMIISAQGTIFHFNRIGE